MTSVTQHKDGFGCPSAFSIVNRENTDSIYLTLRAIVENVPCDRENCQHPFNYFRLPGNLGYRRNTQCAAVVPYKPMVMTDKHEASANACQRLDLQHILCWFHIVKALMEKLKTLNLCLVTSYIVVLGFKIVARSLDRASANQRWILFLEMIDLMDIPAATKIALRKYFVDEWWCDKWRMAWLDVSRLPLIEGGQRTMTTNNHDENLNLQVADCIGSRRKKISTLVTELTGIQAAKENNAATSVVEPKKASLLDTHAAKTIAHDLGKKNSMPADIKLRDNKARLQFLSGGISVVDDTNNSYLLVKDTSSSLKRFRDHKGNWVTVTAEASSVLQGMMTTLMPPSCKHVPKDCVIVNVDNITCTCTDHLWRSSLRDPCHHIKAARMYKKALLMGTTAVQEEEKRLLTWNVKQQQLAKPINGRNLLLCSDDNEIVVSEMQRLHSIHGNKMWEILSTVKKTKIVDRHRPLDLPRDKAVQGKPKQRNAKPRPANPFKRRRKLDSQGAVTIQKPQGEHHPSYSIKRGRNAARRASNKIVSRARQQVLHKLSTPKAMDTRDVHSMPGIGHDVEPTPGCSKDMNRTPVTRKTDSVYSRLITKRLKIESQKRQSTPYQMQLLRFKSPGLSRGKLLVKLSKLKNKPTFSRSGRLIKKKTKGCDFVTP